MEHEAPDHPIELWVKRTPGATRSGLASEVGCHPSRITQIIAGERPSPDLAFKIEGVTGIDARQLLGIQREAAA